MNLLRSLEIRTIIRKLPEHRNLNRRPGSAIRFVWLRKICVCTGESYEKLEGNSGGSFGFDLDRGRKAMAG